MVQQSGSRTWTSSNGVIEVTALGGFDPNYATTTQKKYYYWKFEDSRILMSIHLTVRMQQLCQDIFIMTQQISSM